MAPTARLIAFALGCAWSAAPATSLLAQRADEGAPGSPVRRLRYTVVGTLVGAALAGAYYSIADRSEPVPCDPLGCALPYLSVSGALTGLFLAREIDAQRRADAPRAGVRDRPRIEPWTLPAMPSALTVRDSLIAVVSDSGVSLFVATPSPRALQRRAAGLRGLRDVALLPGNDRLLISSAVALYATGTVAGVASRLLDGDISAVATGGGEWIAARGRTVTVERPALSAPVRVSLDVGEAVRAAVFDDATASWWVGTDSSLLRLTRAPDGSGALAISERITTGGTVRAIATSPHWIAAALGEGGVAAWQRLGAAGGVSAPVRLQTEPRFAYDVAWYHETLLVAGGTDGLVRISLGPTPAVLGVTRELPFATLVKVDANHNIWVGDRGNGTLNRVRYPDGPR